MFYCLITTEAQLHDTLYISMSYISFRSKKDIKVYITFVCVRLRCGRKSQCYCVDSWPANTVTGRARLPLAFAATSTVTLPCSFPWSWKPPAGYVKCFHMKHILVKSVKHQSVFQTESSAIWENSCVAQKLRRGQTTVPDNVSDTLRRTREKTCRGKFFFFYSYFICMYFSWLITSFQKSAWATSSFLRVIMWSSRGGKKRRSPYNMRAPSRCQIRFLRSAVWVRKAWD